MEMHPAEYKILLQTCDDLEARCGEICLNCKECISAVTGFVSNLSRVWNLARMPGILLQSSAKNQLVQDTAMVKVLGRIEISDSEAKDVSIQQKIEEQKRRLLQNDFGNPAVKLIIAMNDVHGTHVNEYEAASENLDYFISNYARLDAGIESLYASLVTTAWTAFEALASDLWVAALNSHPITLAELKGKWHKPERGGTEENEDDDQEQGKLVKLQDLQINNYNLSLSMGNVHKSRYKWGVLEGIRRAYSSAFATDYADVKDAIEHKSLDALSAARNIIVHKAGIVDTQFARKHKGWPPFATVIPGQQLKLDGALIGQLLSNSLENAIRLLNAVDLWLASH